MEIALFPDSALGCPARCPPPAQIPRILNPVVEAVRSLEEMALDPVLGHYVDVGWGGVRNAKMAILSDFFKVPFALLAQMLVVLES